jgi:hypothetical protein
MWSMKAHAKVFIAYLTNNWSGKSEDVHGRSYVYVYRRFGHREMVKEYLEDNTWGV